MRALWWALKLCAGLVLVGCLLGIGLAVVFPTLMDRAGAWLGAVLVSGVVYWIANRGLGVVARSPASARWRGERFVLPAPLVSQGGLCVVLAAASLGVPLALVHGGRLSGGEELMVLLGALLGLWLCRSAVLGYLNLKRAGYALRLDAAGIHYPGLATLPWATVSALALDPPRPDSDRTQCLVLQLNRLPERPPRLQALWRAALPGASISRHAVSLPLPTLRSPSELLDAANTLWRRHGCPGSDREPPSRR